DSVTDRVDRFRPAGLDMSAWRRIAPLVGGVVAEAAPKTAYRAARLLSVTARAVAWCDREGLPLTPEIVLHPDTVDRFAVEGLAGLSRGTQLNYRHQLRRVGEAVL